MEVTDRDGSGYTGYVSIPKYITNPAAGIGGTEADSDNIRVLVFGNEVVVEGAPEGSLITIHDIGGGLLYSGTGTRINVNNGGVKLLTVNGKTFRFAL